jgi:predicted nucleic acid-binding protein
LLSGISDEKKFALLKEKISAFEDVQITSSDYETAAEYSNISRRNGIQGSHTDFLICAVAAGNSMSIFTTDQDFHRYREYINLDIHTVREE